MRGPRVGEEVIDCAKAEKAYQAAKSRDLRFAKAIGEELGPGPLTRIRGAGKNGKAFAHITNKNIRIFAEHCKVVPSDLTISAPVSVNFDSSSSINAETSLSALEYFVPELVRIAAKQVRALDRMVVNFITASVGGTPPGDTLVSLLPSQPVHYPSSVEFQKLSKLDAVLLIEFYDSLQGITEKINEWIRGGHPADFNMWNVLMQMTETNLLLAQKAVRKFCPERQYDPNMPAAGTLLDRSTRALSSADRALAAHLARHRAAGKG